MLLLQLLLSLQVVIRVVEGISCLSTPGGPGPVSVKSDCQVNANACSVSWSGTSVSNVSLNQKACWIDTEDACQVGPCIRKKVRQTEQFVAYFCCCKGDYCNQFPKELPEPTDEPLPKSNPLIYSLGTPSWFIPGLLVPCLVSGLVTMAMVTYCALRRRRRHRTITYQKAVNEKKALPSKLELHKQLCGTFSAYTEEWWLLKPTTSKASLISGEPLTVRISDQASAVRWRAECKLLRHVTFSHPHVVNVLAYGSRGGKQWMVYNDVYSGTLSHTLQHNQPSWEEVKCVGESMYAGLAYLHRTIHAGGRSKPAIAHRDIRPANILIRDRWVAVLGNFHCSSRLEYSNFDNLLMSVETLSKLMLSKHYLAPELLTNTKIPSSFDVVKQGDIYASALVMWQVLRRSAVLGHVEPYSLPFQSLVGEHPTLNDMELIHHQNTRPLLPATSHSGVAKLNYVLSQCWNSNPSRRLTADYVHRVFTSTVTLFGQADTIM